MKKWLIRIFLVILSIGLIIGSFALYKYAFAIKIKGEKLDKAESLLQHGITVQDPKGDFADMKGSKEASGRANNLNPYEIPYCDIKSVSANLDGEYFYYKVNFWGEIPNNAPVIDGDKISGCGVKLNLGNKEGEEQAILLTGYNYILGKSFPKTYYIYGPTGIREPESARYSSKGSDSLIGGGANTDFVLGAFPLDTLKIKKGDTVYLDLQIEAESKKYVHAAVDVLGGVGKSGGRVTWNTTNNTFEVDDEFFNKGQEEKWQKK